MIVPLSCTFRLSSYSHERRTVLQDDTDLRCPWKSISFEELYSELYPDCPIALVCSFCRDLRLEGDGPRPDAAIHTSSCYLRVSQPEN